MIHCRYVFLDEAGNLDFSDNGTRYFVLTSVSMSRPFPLYKELDAYKYDCLEYGLDIERFHCTKDNIHVRKRVFGLIAAHLDDVRIDCLVVEKCKTNPALQEHKRFYPEMLGYLLKYVVKLDDGAGEIIVITDTIPVNKKRQAVEKGVRLALVKMLPVKMRYNILHHASRSHYGLQVADYCCWAIFRKWQKGEMTHYNRIERAVSIEFDIFQHGARYY